MNKKSALLFFSLVSLPLIIGSLILLVISINRDVDSIRAAGASAVACNSPRKLLFGINAGNWPGLDEYDNSATYGSTNTRVALNWDTIVPSRGNYDWTVPDYIFGRVHSNGLDMVALIIGTPDWAKAAGDTRPAHRSLPDRSNRGEYEDFIRRAVQRYPYLDKLEFWNEQNGCGSMVGTGCSYNDISVEEYAYWLDVTYQAIKSVRNSARLAVGGLDGISNETNFMNVMHSKPGGRSYDAVAVHPYEHYGPVDFGWMAQIYGIANKPLWITEYGWVVSTTGALNQANYLRQTLNTLMQPEYNYIELAQLHTYKDFASLDMGLTTSAGIQREAHQVFVELRNQACASTIPSNGSGGSPGNCMVWQETDPFPISIKTHHGPSYAKGNVYYIASPDRKIMQATQQPSGNLGVWSYVNSPGNSGSPREQAALGIGNRGYHFRCDSILELQYDGNNVPIGTSQLDNIFSSCNNWTTATMGNTGVKNMAYVFVQYDFNVVINRLYFGEYTSSGFSGGSFSELNIGFDHYKSAFYSNGSGGYLYTGKLSGAQGYVTSEIYKISVDADGRPAGAWSLAGANVPNNGSALTGRNGTDRGEMFIYNGYLYVTRGTKFSRANINTNGNLGVWESLPDLPEYPYSEGMWGGQSEASAHAVIGNYLYITGVDKAFYISLDGSCATGGTPGSGGSGYLPGVGSSIACNVQEWLVSGSNVEVDPIECPVPMLGTFNPAFCSDPLNAAHPICLGTEPPPGPQSRCDEGDKCYRNPRPEWIRSVPQDVDYGQKDGTALMGEDREYRYYDYDNSLYIDVPPYWFNAGGGSLVGQNPAPGAPGYGGGGGNSLPNVPCGWPSNPPNERVTQGCNTHAPNDPDLAPPSNVCPDDMAASSGCASSLHGYPAIDIGGAFPIYSTMAGTAYRCVGVTQNRPGCPTNGAECYGIFVKVVNGPYVTMNAHLSYVPNIDDTPGIADPGGICGTNRTTGQPIKLVQRTQVQRGSAIGLSASTGNSTGNHLHYEVRFNGNLICPASFMDESNAACTTAGVTFSSGGGGLGGFLNSINPFATREEEEINPETMEREGVDYD